MSQVQRKSYKIKVRSSDPELLRYEKIILNQVARDVDQAFGCDASQSLSKYRWNAFSTRDGHRYLELFGGVLRVCVVMNGTSQAVHLTSPFRTRMVPIASHSIADPNLFNKTPASIIKFCRDLRALLNISEEEVPSGR